MVYSVGTSAARPGLTNTVQQGSIAAPDGKLLWSGGTRSQQERFSLTPAFFIDDRSSGSSCAQFGSCSGSLLSGISSADGHHTEPFEAGGAAGETQRFDFVFERASSQYVEELRTKLDAVQLGVLICSAIISLFGAAGAVFTALEPRALALFGTPKPNSKTNHASKKRGTPQQANPMHGESADDTARKFAALRAEMAEMKAAVTSLEMHRLAADGGSGAITQMAAL